EPRDQPQALACNGIRVHGGPPYIVLERGPSTTKANRRATRVHCAPESWRPPHRILRSGGGAKPCARCPGAFGDGSRRALTEPAQERRDGEREEGNKRRRRQPEVEG